jgi:hypothetical protein
MNKIKSFILAAIIFSSLTGSAQVSKDPNFDIYILIGQSNMAGRGVVTPEFEKEGNPRVFMLNKENTWVLAKNPMHFDKPLVVGVGPGLGFGVAMAEAYPSVKIGLVPCAVGGSPIESWLPGALDPATKTHPYDDAVIRIKEAMRYGTVKGMIWHQGESNSTPAKVKLYMDQLAELITRVRALVGDPNLPFIAGELGRFKPTFDPFNAQIVKLPSIVPFTWVATSENLMHKGDTLHFDSPSAQAFGRRYAVEMLKVQKAAKK